MMVALGVIRQAGRSLLRYWGVSALNIAGLAIGFATVLVISLYIRNELTYDRFMEGADKTYLITSAYGAPDRPLVDSDASPAGLARWLAATPQVQAVARLHKAEWTLRSPRREALARFFWADANIFDLLRLKSVYGDLKTALADPDSLVLTQTQAKFYFGRDDVVGRTLVLNGNATVHITAVLRDLPPNTHLDRDMFISAASGYSMLRALDYNTNWLWDCCYTYMRLKPRASLSAKAVRAIATKNWRGPYSEPVAFRLVPLPDLHFQPESDAQLKPRGHSDTVAEMALIALVVLMLAVGNFAGLLSAQTDERREEMTIRSALGAQSGDIRALILCEALLLNLFSILVGLALTERFLPKLNNWLGLQLTLWASPALVFGLAMLALLIGLTGALYPAAALSRPPDQAGFARQPRRFFTHAGRSGWIALQFTLLITMLVSAHTVQRQWTFATTKALQFDDERVMLLPISYYAGQDTTFKQRVMSLDGVEGVTASRYTPTYMNLRPAWFFDTQGALRQFMRQSIDQNFFSFYRIPLLAGRNFRQTYAADGPPHEIIINRTALTAFGYRHPQDAIGHRLIYTADGVRVQSVIIGVAGDIRTASVREPLTPMVFDSQATYFTLLSIRLRPQQQAQTLSAIHQLWRRSYPNAGPVTISSLKDYLAEQYHDLEQQWRVYALLCCVGGCVTILGLTGLSMYLARAQSREIAIRKALGARFWDIFQLRLRPFIAPWLVANFAAGFAAFGLMSWWLTTFSAHIGLTPASFLMASGLSLVLTLATLSAYNVLTSTSDAAQQLRRR